MHVLVVVPPAPVVMLAEARAHLRVDGTDEDVQITGFVAAATAHIDGPAGWLGRAIGVQTLEATLPRWCVAQRLALPYPPLISVESITFRDAQRQTVTIAAESYEVVDGLVEAIGDAAWSGAEQAGAGLRVRYRAGYETVPPAIRAAILLMTEDLYRNRGEAVIGTTSSQIQMAPTVQALLGPFRRFD